MVSWKPVGIAAEGEPIDVGGVNPWEHEWTPLYEPLELPHPTVPSEHMRFFDVYEIEAVGKRIRFAATRLSLRGGATVWGFYVSAPTMAPRGRA
jgi:hypothetical protein